MDPVAPMTGPAAISPPPVEEPVFFGHDSRLFGLVTRPSPGGANGTGVVVMPGAHFQSANRNRLSVELCRRLAASGVATVRFDYTGIGESLGVLEAYRLDRPLEGDAVAAAALLRDLEVTRIVLVGTCFGARTALAAARPSGAEGVALVSCPVRDFEQGRRSATHQALELSFGDILRKAVRPATLKGLGDRERRAAYLEMLRARFAGRGRSGTPGWVSRSFSDAVDSLEEDGTDLLLVYGSEDQNLRELQLAEDLAKKIGSSDRMVLETIPGEIAGFSDIQTQVEVLQILSDWCLGARQSAPRGAA